MGSEEGRDDRGICEVHRRPATVAAFRADQLYHRAERLALLADDGCGAGALPAGEHAGAHAAVERGDRARRIRARTAGVERLQAAVALWRAGRRATAHVRDSLPARGAHRQEVSALSLGTA